MGLSEIFALVISLSVVAITSLSTIITSYIKNNDEANAQKERNKAKLNALYLKAKTRAGEKMARRWEFTLRRLSIYSSYLETVISKHSVESAAFIASNLEKMNAKLSDLLTEVEDYSLLCFDLGSDYWANSSAINYKLMTSEKIFLDAIESWRIFDKMHPCYSEEMREAFINLTNKGSMASLEEQESIDWYERSEKEWCRLLKKVQKTARNHQIDVDKANNFYQNEMARMRLELRKDFYSI
jgi:hypothetical protein